MHLKTVTELHIFFFFLVWSSFTSLYSLTKVKSNLIISYTINHSMGTVCPQKILVTSNSFPRARIIQNNQLSLSSEMIDKTITKFCWGYCSKSDFFISKSGIPYSWSRKSSSISHPLARTISCVTEWRGINCPVVSATFWKALQSPFWKKQGTDIYTPKYIMYTVWHKK